MSEAEAYMFGLSYIKAKMCGWVQICEVNFRFKNGC